MEGQGKAGRHRQSLVVGCLESFDVSAQRLGTLVNGGEPLACGVIHSRSPTDARDQP